MILPSSFGTARRPGFPSKTSPLLPTTLMLNAVTRTYMYHRYLRFKYACYLPPRPFSRIGPHRWDNLVNGPWLMSQPTYVLRIKHESLRCIVRGNTGISTSE